MSARVVWLSLTAVLAAAPEIGVTAAGAVTLPGAASAAGAAAMTGPPVAAVWKERRIDFLYSGRTARYSCDGLRDKVRALLLDLGARRDVTIAASGCEADDRLRGEPPQPNLNVVFSAPALADAAAKRLRAGDPAATAARFEAFMITSDAFRNMDVGDCELVEEFARQILPTLVTRAVRQDITCVPAERSGSHFWVRGEILKTVPRAERFGRERHAP